MQQQQRPSLFFFCLHQQENKNGFQSVLENMNEPKGGIKIVFRQNQRREEDDGPRGQRWFTPKKKSSKSSKSGKGKDESMINLTFFVWLIKMIDQITCIIAPFIWHECCLFLKDHVRMISSKDTILGKAPCKWYSNNLQFEKSEEAHPAVRKTNVQIFER